MLKNIKQVFVALLSLSNSLASKCETLSNEPCMARPALIDLDPVKLNHYHSFMTSLDKCSGNICENGKYLKSIADDSKIVCDEVINVTECVSKIFITKM